MEDHEKDRSVSATHIFRGHVAMHFRWQQQENGLRGSNVFCAIRHLAFIADYRHSPLAYYDRNVIAVGLLLFVTTHAFQCRKHRVIDV